MIKKINILSNSVDINLKEVYIVANNINVSIGDDCFADLQCKQKLEDGNYISTQNKFKTDEIINHYSKQIIYEVFNGKIKNIK